MDNNLWSSIIRILRSLDTKVIPIGVGFLVSENHAVTCSHVISELLDIPRDTNELPSQEIFLDFPLIDSNTPISANVIFWDHNTDIALLELNISPPNDSRPINISFKEELADHEVWIYGTPYGDEDGNWVRAVVMGPTGAGFYHFESRSGYRPELGFSGGPVWDDQLKAVVGMVVAVDEGRPAAGAGRMMPSSSLDTILKKLKIPIPINTLLVPHSRESEEALIGSILVDPEIYYEVSQFVSQSDFYIHRHKWIWGAFDKISELRLPIDVLHCREGT